MRGRRLGTWEHFHLSESPTGESCGLVASDQDLGGNWGSPVIHISCVLEESLTSGRLGRGEDVAA